MLHIRTLAFGITAAAFLTSALGGSAVGASHAPRFASQVNYTFDNGESLADGSTVINVGHPHFPGRVATAYSGKLTVVAGRVDRGAGFPRTCATCGRGIIQASDRPGLDPGARPISFGVTLKVTPLQAEGTSNILQKGLFNEVGGQYKLQMSNGRPSCVIRGSHGRIIVHSKVSVADGTWHTVGCSRIRARVTLRVDGKISARVLGPTGVISNGAPVRVGGLALIKANNQYHGNLDSVYVRISR